MGTLCGAIVKDMSGFVFPEQGAFLWTVIHHRTRQEQNHGMSVQFTRTGTQAPWLVLTQP